jgi:hypothetical protein
MNNDITFISLIMGIKLVAFYEFVKFKKSSHNFIFLGVYWGPQIRSQIVIQRLHWKIAIVFPQCKSLMTT